MSLAEAAVESVPAPVIHRHHVVVDSGKVSTVLHPDIAPQTQATCYARSYLFSSHSQQTYPGAGVWSDF